MELETKYFIIYLSETERRWIRLVNLCVSLTYFRFITMERILNEFLYQSRNSFIFRGPSRELIMEMVENTIDSIYADGRLDNEHAYNNAIHDELTGVIFEPLAFLFEALLGETLKTLGPDFYSFGINEFGVTFENFIFHGHAYFSKSTRG